MNEIVPLFVGSRLFFVCSLAARSSVCLILDGVICHLSNQGQRPLADFTCCTLREHNSFASNLVSVFQAGDSFGPFKGLAVPFECYTRRDPVEKKGVQEYEVHCVPFSLIAGCSLLFLGYILQLNNKWRKCGRVS